MLKFVFSISHQSSEIHEFDLGHLAVLNEHAKITSEGKEPDQGMMIFISVSQLLYVIEQLISSKKNAAFEFNGADSSFSIVFKRYNDGTIGLWNSQKLFAKTTAEELIVSVWKGVRDFYEKYAENLIGSGAAKEDWDMGMARYYEKFKEIVNKPE